MDDKGDVWFEKSRHEAQAAYEKLKANPPENNTIDLGEVRNVRTLWIAVFKPFLCKSVSRDKKPAYGDVKAQS